MISWSLSSPLLSGLHLLLSQVFSIFTKERRYKLLVGYGLEVLASTLALLDMHEALMHLFIISFWRKLT